MLYVYLVCITLTFFLECKKYLNIENQNVLLLHFNNTTNNSNSNLDITHKLKH